MRSALAPVCVNKESPLECCSIPLSIASWYSDSVSALLAMRLTGGRDMLDIVDTEFWRLIACPQARARHHRGALGFPRGGFWTSFNMPKF